MMCVCRRVLACFGGLNSTEEEVKSFVLGVQFSKLRIKELKIVVSIIK